MSNKTLPLTESLYSYLLQNSLREPEILKQLREETASNPMARMQIAPEQGQFMSLLVQLIGAQNALEIGVFTGYSSLSVALALPASGKLVACDVNEEWTTIASRYWKQAGVADKIQLYIAPALTTLDRLLDQGEAGTFDFVFIDADKDNYLNYYERALKFLRPGGIILVDNVLWGGSVANPNKRDKETLALRKFNQFVLRDSRVLISMIPMADGLTLALKKPAPN